MRNVRSTHFGRESKAERQGWSDDEDMPYLEYDQPPHPHDESTSTRFNRRYGTATQAGPLGRLPIAPLEEVPVPVVRREAMSSQVSQTSQPSEPSASNAGLNTRARLPRQAHARTFRDFYYAPEVTLFLYYIYIFLLTLYNRGIMHSQTYFPLIPMLTIMRLMGKGVRGVSSY